MPELTKAQLYQDLTDAVDMIGQHREKYFSRRIDHLPWWFLKRVQGYIETQRSVEFKAIFNPPKERIGLRSFWKNFLKPKRF